MNATPEYDAIVIGGGPGGSTTAMVLARAGKKVVLLEKDQHPRFHIGESILPRNMRVLRELGLEERFKTTIPHVVKLGAEFGMGDDPNTMKFVFKNGLLPGESIFNIERAPFDKMLIDEARASGAQVFENTPVKSINRIEDGFVEVATDGRTFTGRVVMDASGHGTVVARRLGTRKNFDEPELQKVAYFQHFENVQRLPGGESGHPSLFMTDEGWFWVIALNDTRTSVGFVTRPGFVKQLRVAPDKLLQWAIARCPMVRQRMQNATGEPWNHVLSNFSYNCAPYAGPGYFLIGDAGCFLDPVFSTGVTLAMVGGQQAAKLAIDMLDGRLQPGKAQKAYCKFVSGSTSVFWRLIRGYYSHGFRELFLQGTGPMQLPGAVISTLAGQVFPRPPFALRWRLRMFELCVWIQERYALSPRRKRFKLVDEAPVELPGIAAERALVNA